MYNFAPAAPELADQTVYGACRPGHRRAPAGDTVNQWCQFMREQGITRVCCLLDAEHLSVYDDLLGHYRRTFGSKKVCHAPMPDFERVERIQFTETILPFLRAARTAGESVVVHCSAGSGRTGHVLVLWLVAERGYTLDEAVATVEGTGRSPLEGTTKAALRDLLE